MQQPTLSEVSIRFSESGGQLGPIVSGNRPAVDLNSGAEAPLSVRDFLTSSVFLFQYSSYISSRHAHLAAATL